MSAEALWAIPELTDLAAAMRPDWDREEVRGKLIAMRNASVPPCLALIEIARTMGHPGSVPRALLDTIPANAPRPKPEPVDPADSPALAKLRAEHNWPRPEPEPAAEAGPAAPEPAAPSLADRLRASLAAAGCGQGEPVKVSQVPGSEAS